MSGPLGSQQWMYATETPPFYSYPIDNSLRFDGSNSYMYYVPSISTTRTKWTFSAWVKRAKLGVRQYVVIAWDDSSPTNDQTRLLFADDDTIGLLRLNSGTYWENRNTTRVFRDTSAWYHIVWALDAQNTTQALRSRLYVNGEEIPYSDFTVTNAPSATGSSFFCTAGVQTNLGTAVDNQSGSTHTTPISTFDGYLADAQLIDGQTLDPTSFGEMKSDIWVPKDYTGSYGTNGFHLDFADGTSATTLGYDAAGSNDFTPSGIATSDQMLDSPTNNFCVFNELDKATNNVNSEGNLKTVTSVAGYGLTKSTIVMSTARETTNQWYAEFYYQDNTDAAYVALIGITEAGTDPNSTAYQSTTTYGYYPYDGAFYDAGIDVAYGATYAPGDIIGVSFDEATGELEFFKNNVSQGVAKSGLSGDFVFFAADGGGSRSVTIVANFGQDSSFAGNKTRQNNADENGYGDFYYTPPSGHLALCTANLPAPTFDPEVGASPQDAFNVVTYTGDGQVDHSITGVGFQPDFTWIKSRSAAYNHALQDSVRGATNVLFSNLTNAQSTSSRLSSFDSDGFTLTDNAPGNASGETYVAWNWKLGGSANTFNIDGTGYSTASAAGLDGGTQNPTGASVNTDAGVGVYTYTGDGTTKTIAHGLGIAPSVVLIKNRSNSADWLFYTNAVDGSMDFSYLNDTISFSTSNRIVTSTTFNHAGSPNQGAIGNDYVAWVFAEKEGFSKFGSYEGNLDADGPFVYLGFRPAFVIVKSTDSTSLYASWTMFDGARPSYNDGDAGDALYANHSVPEGYRGTGTTTSNLYPKIDLLSNGFKLRSVGSEQNNENTYFYMAFAEQPFKYSNAR